MSIFECVRPLLHSWQTLLINMGVFFCQSSAPPEKGIIVKTLHIWFCLTNQSQPWPGGWRSAAAPSINPELLGLWGDHGVHWRKAELAGQWGVGRGAERGGCGGGGKCSGNYGRKEVFHYVSNWCSRLCVNEPSIHLAQNCFQHHHGMGHVGA